MSKIACLFNIGNEIYTKINNSPYEAIRYEAGSPIELQDFDYCIDFTHLNYEGKCFLAEQLNHQTEFFMDLTCFNNEEFHMSYDNLLGSFSSLLLTKTNKIEVTIKDKHEVLEGLLNKLELSPLYYKNFGTGFVYPRTLSMIVNEAYFALDQGVANQTDIDRAMTFGVNYPRGPFEWSFGKEKIIVQLLETLQKHDPNRYEIAESLLKVARG